MDTKNDAKDDKQVNSTVQCPSYGYQIYDMKNIAEKWKCVFCSYIIKEPVQLVECGHRCCRGCFESRIGQSSTGKIKCPGEDCDYEFDREETMTDRAFKRELDVLPISCIHKNDQSSCSWRGTLNMYQEHLDANHTNFICENCQESFSSTEALKTHIATVCPHFFQTCPFGSHCTGEMIRREHFAAHLLTEKHQEATVSLLIGKYNMNESPNQDQEMETTTAHNELEDETSEKLSELADKVQTLNDQTIQLSHDFIKLNELYEVANQEVNHFQTACVDRNSVMSTLQTKQDAIQKEIEQMKQNLEENQYTFTDGTLTWRVDRVTERMADAQSDRQPSIFSPIFYSSPHGYKMRARLYLHGDGNARRSHMSLFFLLMKGDHDALLPWPFSHKVTFCLFDQTGNNRHIIDSFRPDVKSNSFQRPTNDANIASGIPRFFPLTMIQQDDNPYVREDVMFLKIMIDLHDTPKTLLPYMLTLNPGLPNHVQQILMNNEKNKQQQQQMKVNTPT